MVIPKKKLLFIVQLNQQCDEVQWGVIVVAGAIRVIVMMMMMMITTGPGTILA